jgi:CBS domain-containing protein
MTLPEARTDKYNEYFKELAVGSFPKPTCGKVITLRDADTVKEATKTLTTFNILSAPVIDTTARPDAGWLEKYCGTIDAVNLCYWLLKEAVGDYENFADLLQHDMASKKIGDIVTMDPNTARFLPFTPLDSEENTVLDCMLLMGKYGLHRCYVVNSGTHELVGVVTQSMLVQFLHDHMPVFKAISEQTIAELKIGTYSQLVTVTQDNTFMDAFTQIQLQQVSAVPVLDGQDQVVGVVSARDARLLITRPFRLPYIYKPLSFWKQLQIQPFNVEPITVKKSATLHQIIDIFAKTQIHRVFVVDDDKHLLGVVSLRDVLAAFVVEPRDSQLGNYFTK